jgi:hypothetical protein
MQMMVEGDCFAEEGGNGGIGGWVCCASFDGEQDWSCDCAQDRSLNAFSCVMRWIKDIDATGCNVGNKVKK